MKKTMAAIIILLIFTSCAKKGPFKPQRIHGENLEVLLSYQDFNNYNKSTSNDLQNYL